MIEDLNKSSWITYELKDNPKEISIFKKIDEKTPDGITLWLCVIAGKNEMKGQWNEGEDYTQFNFGEFLSFDPNNKTERAVTCICRPSTDEEIELAKQTLIISKL